MWPCIFAGLIQVSLGGQGKKKGTTLSNNWLVKVFSGRKYKRYLTRHRAFLWSLVVHIGVLTILFSALDQPTSYQQPKSSPVPVQKATSIAAVDVAREVRAIKSEREAAVVAQQKRLRRWKNRVSSMQSQQKTMQKKLLQQTKAMKTRKSELQKLRRTQLAEKKQLQQLTQKREDVKKAVISQEKNLQQMRKAMVLLKKKQQQAHSEATRQRLLQEQKKLEASMRHAQLSADQNRLNREKQLLQSGVINRYRAKILAAIQREWIVPKEVRSGVSCKFLLRLSTQGKVLGVDLLKSSGSGVLDRSARVAVFKASPLPIPTDPALSSQFRSIRLTVRPIVR